jgi:hypothetical protein
MKKKLSENNLKFIILVFIFLIGIGTFLVRESFASMQQQELQQDGGGGGGGGGGGYVPPPPPPPTVTVTITSNLTPTVPYGGSTIVSWTSSLATSCTRSDTGASIGTSGSFTTGPLYSSTTLTITCRTVSYCSGNYNYQKISWVNDTSVPTSGVTMNATSAHTYDWVQGQESYPKCVWTSGSPGVWDCGPCTYCGEARANNVAYSVEDGVSWSRRDCVWTKVAGLCFNPRWAAGRAYAGPAYSLRSCSSLSSSVCSSTAGCTWHP